MKPDPSRFPDVPTLRGLVLVSGAFSLILVIGLIAWGAPYAYPAWFESKAFVALRAAVEADPGNDQAVAAFRQEDQRRMQVYFASRAKLAKGAWLLAGGLFVFLVSLRQLAALTRRLPVPHRRVEGESETRARRALVSVPLAGALLGVAALGLILALTPAPPPATGEPGRGTDKPVVVDKPVPDHLKWPLFRGPTGMGLVPAGAYLTHWDASQGEGILWKEAISLPGRGSPVVWGERVFVTGADVRARKVFCYDRLSGKRLWDKTVVAGARIPSDSPAFTTSDINAGPAACTPVTDGKRVYALFGTGELAALDMEGKQVWSHWLGLAESSYGFASSPTLYNDKLIVQFDQGGEGDQKSALIAYDCETGKEAWRVPRPVGNAWSSPVVASVGGKALLLTASIPWAMAYDPATGKEFWRANLFFGDVATLPIADDERIYVTGHEADVIAIKVGGIGDITESHVAWRNEEAMPGTSSPIVKNGLYVQATDAGSIICLEARTGKRLWEKEVSREAFYTSLTAVGSSVYAVDRKGVAYVLALDRTYMALGQGTVGEVVEATPAFVDNRIYVRGAKHLFCIGKSEP